MLHGSWFLPQLYHVTSVGGKNRGEAKPPNGEPGCPRPHDLAARPGARSSALYRSDNSTIKCPARHVGLGFLAGGETRPACRCTIRESRLQFQHGGVVCETDDYHRTHGRKEMLNYGLCDFTF